MESLVVTSLQSKKYCYTWHHKTFCFCFSLGEIWLKSDFIAHDVHLYTSLISHGLFTWTILKYGRLVEDYASNLKYSYLIPPSLTNSDENLIVQSFLWCIVNTLIHRTVLVPWSNPRQIKSLNRLIERMKAVKQCFQWCSVCNMRYCLARGLWVKAENVTIQIEALGPLHLGSPDKIFAKNIFILCALT